MPCLAICLLQHPCLLRLAVAQKSARPICARLHPPAPSGTAQHSALSHKRDQHTAVLPVDDCVHHDLDGVLVCEQVDDVKGMLHDAHLTRRASNTQSTPQHQHT